MALKVTISSVCFDTVHIDYPLYLLMCNRDLDTIAINEANANIIWHPKMTFLNLLSLKKFQGVGYKSIRNYYYMPNENPAKIYMFETFKLKFSCDFSFQTFPFDKHECHLSYIDWRFKSEELVFNATRKIKHGNQHLAFGNKYSLKLTTTKTPFEIDVTINDAATKIGGGKFKFSIAGIKFNLYRKSIGLLLGSFYVPTGIFAILSMGSFVINPEVVSSKMLHCFSGSFQHFKNISYG